MIYIEPATNKYPISETDIRVLHPNTSFPNPFVAPDGYMPVFPADPPSFNPLTHKAVEVSPVIASGKYVQSFNVVPLSQEEVAANMQAHAQAVFLEIQTNIQHRLDEFARTRFYDDIKSAADYAGDDDPIFNREGTYCKQMRSQTWRIGINLMNDVLAGTRSMPSGYSEIESELPVLSWPA